MMGKTIFIKTWRTFLGIATELIMTVFIMAAAFGLSWLIIKGIK
jgi:hypothetical protein